MILGYTVIVQNDVQTLRHEYSKRFLEQLRTEETGQLT